MFALLLPDPPPPELLLVLEEPEELDRVVPLNEVLALEEMLPDELELERTEVCEVVGEVVSAEVAWTLDAVELLAPLPDDSAEVEAEAEEPPCVVLAVNKLLVVAEPPAPAPEEDPPVFEACAATVPVVEA